MATATTKGIAGSSTRRKIFAQRLLVLSAMAVVAFSAIAAVRQPTTVLKERLPIESVRVEGALRHVARDELVEALRREIDGGFFGVDVRRVQRAAVALPWIKEAAVRRRWPDGLEVAVVERRPVARWHRGQLVDESAMLLPRLEFPGVEALPLMEGPESSTPEMLAQLRRLMKDLDRIGGGIKRLRLSALGVWTVEFSNDMLLLFDHDQYWKIEQFSTIYPLVIEPRLEQIERIDLRYANGFAVRWREGMMPPGVDAIHGKDAEAIAPSSSSSGAASRTQNGSRSAG